MTFNKIFIPLVIILAISNGLMYYTNTSLESDIDKLSEKQESLKNELKDYERVMDKVEDKLEQYKEIQKEYEEILDVLEIDTKNTTMYAPRDPRAVEGGCFQGDRNITASGETITEYRTAAAGPGVEFGTKVYIEGKGLFEVQDRGGAIGDGDLDLAVDSLDEADRWGRREKRAIIIRE